MKKTTVFLLMIVLLVSGCSHVEDTNGDDTSLVTITAEKLIGTSTGQTTSGVSSNNTRNNITTVGIHEDIDFDFIELSGGPTSGIGNILATELDEGDTLLIECESSVVEGNLQIVLISPSNELIHSFPTGAYDAVEFTASEDGDYLVRMGSESFDGVILVARTIE